MKRFAQVVFFLSMIGLTIFWFLPLLEGLSWQESFFGGVLPFGIAVIVSWIFSSGLRHKDKQSGKKFGWPRIRWGWVGLWCSVVGIIVSIGAGFQVSNAERSLTWEKNPLSWEASRYRDKLEDAQGARVLGGILSAVGGVCYTIVGARALRRRRRVRLEI